MNSQLHQLADRIHDELAEIEQIQQRIETGWQRVQRSNDDYYWDGVALNLHGFYSGLERIFELIATFRRFSWRCFVSIKGGSTKGWRP